MKDYILAIYRVAPPGQSSTILLFIVEYYRTRSETEKF